MKARPILFSTSMVKALLDGRKTQTRRIAKCGNDNCINMKIFVEKYGKKVMCRNHILDERNKEICPYGKIGDFLWVRETFWLFSTPHKDVVEGKGHQIIKEDFKNGWGNDLFKAVYYKADEIFKLGRWKPSIFLPRWASRISLEITNIRVESLKNISEEDAINEGIEGYDSPTGGDDYQDYWKNYTLKDKDVYGSDYTDPIQSYASLWESINGKGSWNLNPWVWVIEFKVHKRNFLDIIKGKDGQ